MTATCVTLTLSPLPSLLSKRYNKWTHFAYPLNNCLSMPFLLSLSFPLCVYWYLGNTNNVKWTVANHSCLVILRNVFISSFGANFFFVSSNLIKVGLEFQRLHQHLESLFGIDKGDVILCQTQFFRSFFIRLHFMAVIDIESSHHCMAYAKYKTTYGIFWTWEKPHVIMLGWVMEVTLDRLSKEEHEPLKTIS